MLQCPRQKVPSILVVIVPGGSVISALFQISNDPVQQWNGQHESIHNVYLQSKYSGAVVRCVNVSGQ
jgi:hypothetical protein